VHSAAMVTRRVRTDGFIDPCIPTLAAKPPSGPGWVHEIKHDGYRLIVRRDGTAVRLFTRRGYDWTDRYPAIAAAAAKLRAKSFTLDGEAVVCGADGVAIFDALHRRHKTAASRPDIRNGPITPCIALTDASREKVAIFGQSNCRTHLCFSRNFLGTAFRGLMFLFTNPYHHGARAFVVNVETHLFFFAIVVIIDHQPIAGARRSLVLVIHGS
jgi:hypothetical protein